MVRRRGWVRLAGTGFRGAVALGLAFALVAPACGGQSVTDGDGGAGEPPRPPTDDDDVVDDDDIVGDGDGAGGSIAQGGMGAFGNTGGVGVTGGSFPMGGTVPVGGTVATGGVSITGGRPPTGGVGGIPATGGTLPTSGAGPAAGAGGAGGASSDPECKGIRNNMACPLEGKLCQNLACGLADSGRRTCACATNWACTTCDYTNSPFRDPPAMIPRCSADVADEVACTQVNTVCGPVGAEYCACYSSPIDGLIWDCDSPPSTW